MFNNLFKQFIKDSKQIKLTKQEKSQFREQLLNFIEVNPVRTNLAMRHQSTWSRLINYKFYNIKPMPILLSIILTLSAATGITFASQSSLPGDALYPVKIGSEEVRSALTFSTKAKAELETKLAQERLQEAEELSNEAKLNADVRARLETNFEEHANRVEERTNDLSSVDAKAAASISSNFETSLQAHDRILTKLAADKDGQTAPQINQLLLKVRAQTKNANQNRLQIQSRDDSKTEIDDSASEHEDGELKVKLGL